MGKSAPLAVLLLVLAGCRQPPDEGAPAAGDGASDEATVANLPDADINASLADITAGPLRGEEESFRFAGRWAAELDACGTAAWTVSADALRAPTGAECRFADLRPVPGGYDIAARCTEGGAERHDRLELRFAESAGALLVESATLGEAGLIACPE